MPHRFQGDVHLFQTPDGGEISVASGLTEMAPSGLGVAAYLSLFGGNELDDGRPDNPNGYWGNLLELDEAFKYVSRTQNLLRSIPLTSGNLLRLQRAALADLAWFIDKAIASSLTVVVTVSGLDRANFVVDITAEGELHRFTFTENWKGGAE